MLKIFLFQLHVLQQYLENGLLLTSMRQDIFHSAKGFEQVQQLLFTEIHVMPAV